MFAFYDGFAECRIAGCLPVTMRVVTSGRIVSGVGSGDWSEVREPNSGCQFENYTAL